MKKQKFSPHGPIIREGLTYHQTKTDGTNEEVPFSILNVPADEKLANGLMADLGMVSNFDIATFRENHKADIERIRQELGEKKLIYDAKGDFSLSIRMANQEKEGEPKKPTICVLTSWSTTGDMENVQLDLEAMALIFPEYRVLHITTPGTDDESSLLTKDAIQKMVDTGSYRPMAEQMADVLENNPELCDIETMVETSEGACIPLAAELKKRKIADVKKVFIFDAPGLKEERLSKFVTNFVITEGLIPHVGHLAKIKASSPDRLMAEAHTRDAKKYKIKPGHDLWSRARAMARGGTAIDLRDAVESGVQVLEFSAGSSSITNTNAAIELSQNLPGYKVIEIPRAGHGFYEINPFMIPLFIKAATAF